MDEEWFIVTNIEEFTNKARSIVYNNFGKWEDDKSEIDSLIDSVKEEEKEDLEKVLSYNESLLIVKELLKKQRNIKTNSIRYSLDDQIFLTIIEKLNDRMVSNILNALANKGLIESSYDCEKNDFVFWIKDEKEPENPETDWSRFAFQI